MVFKHQLTPLTKGGAIHKHKGKGSEQTSIPNRSELTALAKPANQNINNYSKATPMANPQPDAATSGIGLGSGSWAGNGM